MELNIKTLNQRATKLTSSRKKNNISLQELLCDEVQYAQENADNYDPLVHLVNRLEVVDVAMIAKWLPQISPAYIKRNDDGSFTVRKSKSKDALPYNIDLARTKMWFVKDAGESKQAEYDRLRKFKSLCKAIVKNEIITSEIRAELHADLDAMLDEVLADNKKAA